MTSPHKPDQDKPEEDKSFLARWSQRKQEANQPKPKQDAPAATSDIPSEPIAEVEAEPEFDLSTLPKLEELTETTDITGFLRKGVPEHLRNAALRKSWALDPAIRNYVNPALDYAYDWNTPGGVPGNSELGAGIDVARMVSQIMGSGPAESPIPADGPAIEQEGASASSAKADLSPKPSQDPPVQSVRREEEKNLSENDGPAAVQSVQSEAANSVASQQPLRRHGTAKPIV
jgi:Protein of unknown function (DUF3306)